MPSSMGYETTGTQVVYDAVYDCKIIEPLHVVHQQNITFFLINYFIN